MQQEAPSGRGSGSGGEPDMDWWHDLRRRWAERWDAAINGEMEGEMDRLRREQDRLRREQERQRREAAELERRVRRLTDQVAILTQGGG